MLDLKFDEKNMDNYFDILDDHQLDEEEKTVSEFEGDDIDDLNDISNESEDCVYKDVRL